MFSFKVVVSGHLLGVRTVNKSLDSCMAIIVHVDLYVRGATMANKNTPIQTTLK